MYTPHIEWIGTGSGLNPVLGNTSFLVRGKERTLLVDCGYTVPFALMKSGQLQEVTDVVLTHAHADHIGGVEPFSFMNYFVYKRRGKDRPHLHVASDDFVRSLWEHSLKGGLEKLHTNEGLPMNASLETYFKIHIGKSVVIPSIPRATLFPTPHVQHMENYGVLFANGILYSGDTVALPPTQPKMIFQDCQFYETKSDDHISYEKLKRELSPETKAKTYLVHLGNGWDKKDAKADGFAGFVQPKDTFKM